MTTPTTARHDIAAGIVATLTAFRTAHPSLLLGVHAARPSGFPDLPAAYLDGFSEPIHHYDGLRTRDIQVSVVVVRRITDNAETMAAFHTLIDLMVDAFTAVPQFASNTIWSDVLVADEDAPFGDYDFAGVRFTFPAITVKEGRN